MNEWILTRILGNWDPQRQTGRVDKSKVTREETEVGKRVRSLDPGRCQGNWLGGLEQLIVQATLEVCSFFFTSASVGGFAGLQGPEVDRQPSRLPSIIDSGAA